MGWRQRPLQKTSKHHPHRARLPLFVSNRRLGLHGSWLAGRVEQGRHSQTWCLAISTQLIGSFYPWQGTLLSLGRTTARHKDKGRGGILWAGRRQLKKRRLTTDEDQGIMDGGGQGAQVQVSGSVQWTWSRSRSSVSQSGPQGYTVGPCFRFLQALCQRVGLGNTVLICCYVKKTASGRCKATTQARTAPRAPSSRRQNCRNQTTNGTGYPLGEE